MIVKFIRVPISWKNRYWFYERINRHQWHLLCEAKELGNKTVEGLLQIEHLNRQCNFATRRCPQISYKTWLFFSIFVFWVIAYTNQKKKNVFYSIEKIWTNKHSIACLGFYILYRNPSLISLLCFCIAIMRTSVLGGASAPKGATRKLNWHLKKRISLGFPPFKN